MDNLVLERMDEKMPFDKDKEYFVEALEKTKDYLTKLSHCTLFLNDLLVGEEESIEFISSSFDLLKKLSQLLGDPKSFEELVKTFKDALSQDSKNEKIENLFASLNNSSVDLESFSLDKDELEDEINYLYIWTLNSYKLDLKSNTVEEIKKKFGELFKKEVFRRNFEENLAAQEDGNCCGEDSCDSECSSSPRARGWAGHSVYRNLFKTERWVFGDPRLNKDEDSFEYLVSRTKALERLEREIRSGKVYVFTEKPLKNLKWKQVFSNFLIAGLVFSVLAIIYCITENKFKMQESSSKGLFEDCALFSLMSFLFFFLTRRENNKFGENENFKYCFSRKIFYYFFLLSLFFAIAQNKDFTQIFTLSNSGNVLFMVIFVPLMFLVVSSIVIFLIGFFFLNPKKNKALIENLLNKYSYPPYMNN